jgi:hypothetical protein
MQLLTDQQAVNTAVPPDAGGGKIITHMIFFAGRVLAKACLKIP